MATLPQTSSQAFIKRHPVLTYYALVFALSWGGILLIIGGPGGIPGIQAQVARLLPFVMVAWLAGPSVASILLTGLVKGSAGIRSLLSRLLRWRVGARWYAVALLTIPLLITAILFALSLTSPIFLPSIVTTADKATLLLSSIAVGLTTVFEELGWTGFAVPELRKRFGILPTGLIVGLLWGAYHFSVMFWVTGSPSGGFSLDLLLPSLLFYVAVLPVYRVLMVWIYDRTGSLLVVTLMHASLTVSTLFILVPQARGVPNMIYYLILIVALWVVVAVVAVANGGKLSRGKNVSTTRGGRSLPMDQARTKRPVPSEGKNGRSKNMSPFTREQLLELLQSNTSLAGIDLGGINLESIDLEGVNLNSTNLWGARLTGAHLKGADLSRANLHFANLRGADLSEARLTEADLGGADLHQANLSRADLSKAKLSRASLHQANLSGANLSGTNLRWADLAGASLEGAELDHADLHFTNLRGARLAGVSLGAHT